MIDLLVLILLSSVVCIWFFIKKRPNKTFRNLAILTSAISFIAIGVLAPNKQKIPAKEVASSEKSIAKKAPSINIKSNFIANGAGAVTISGIVIPNKYVKIGADSAKADDNGNFKLQYVLPNSETTTVKIRIVNDEYDTKALATKDIKIKSAYDSIRLGMTKDEITKILGTPTVDNQNVIYYGTQSLSFIDNRLVSGTPNQLASQISNSASESNENKTKKEPTEQQKQQAQQEHVRSFARTFGNKPAQEIQEKSYAYSSRNVAGLGMVYMWKVDKDILMRIDGSDNITSVYLYDKNAENGKGQLLYQGHTIINKQKKQYNFYN